MRARSERSQRPSARAATASRTAAARVTAGTRPPPFVADRLGGGRRARSVASRLFFKRRRSGHRLGPPARPIESCGSGVTRSCSSCRTLPRVTERNALDLRGCDRPVKLPATGWLPFVTSIISQCFRPTARSKQEWRLDFRPRPRRLFLIRWFPQLESRRTRFSAQVILCTPLKRLPIELDRPRRCFERGGDTPRIDRGVRCSSKVSGNERWYAAF